jgi:polyribonucleotide nucleotidyltransferase
MTRYRAQLRETLLTQGKKARGNAVKDLETSIVAGIPAEETERIEATRAAFQEMETSVFRDVVVQEQTRLDGRSFKEIRPITINLAALPRTHGEGKSSKAPRKRGALFWATLTSLLSPTIVDWVQIQSASRIVLCSRISS